MPNSWKAICVDLNHVCSYINFTRKHATLKIALSAWSNPCIYKSYKVWTWQEKNVMRYACSLIWFLLPVYHCTVNSAYSELDGKRFCSFIHLLRMITGQKTFAWWPLTEDRHVMEDKNLFTVNNNFLYPSLYYLRSFRWQQRTCLTRGKQFCLQSTKLMTNEVILSRVYIVLYMKFLSLLGF